MKKNNSKRKNIYLDYAAATPTSPRVLRKMLPYFQEHFGNPSSMHSSGRRAQQVIERCRQQIADIIGSHSEEIIFTGSGTESDNLAIKGIAYAHRSYGNHIIISSVEHKAITESVQQLERDGFTVSVVPVDSHGLIDINACVGLITPTTILISVMYANNEIGTIQPIRELSIAIRKWQLKNGHVIT